MIKYIMCLLLCLLSSGCLMLCCLVGVRCHFYGLFWGNNFLKFFDRKIYSFVVPLRDFRRHAMTLKDLRRNIFHPRAFKALLEEFITKSIGIPNIETENQKINSSCFLFEKHLFVLVVRELNFYIIFSRRFSKKNADYSSDFFFLRPTNWQIL